MCATEELSTLADLGSVVEEYSDEEYSAGQGGKGGPAAPAAPGSAGGSPVQEQQQQPAFEAPAVGAPSGEEEEADKNAAQAVPEAAVPLSKEEGGPACKADGSALGGEEAKVEPAAPPAAAAATKASSLAPAAEEITPAVGDGGASACGAAAPRRRGLPDGRDEIDAWIDEWTAWAWGQRQVLLVAAGAVAAGAVLLWGGWRRGR